MEWAQIDPSIRSYQSSSQARELLTEFDAGVERIKGWVLAS